MAFHDDAYNSLEDALLAQSSVRHQEAIRAANESLADAQRRIMGDPCKAAVMPLEGEPMEIYGLTTEYIVSAEAPPVVVRADTATMRDPIWVACQASYRIVAKRLREVTLWAGCPRRITDRLLEIANDLDPDEDFTDEDETDVEDRT